MKFISALKHKLNLMRYTYKDLSKDLINHSTDMVATIKEKDKLIEELISDIEVKDSYINELHELISDLALTDDGRIEAFLNKDSGEDNAK